MEALNNTDKLAGMIMECSNIVFFGGAGVSTESGVKDYRSEDGLYNTVKEYGISPEEILSHDFFFENTEVFYDFYRKYFISAAKPNNAHKALALLEKAGKLKTVITQNIDGLHQMAGSRNVIELHGTANEFVCCSCGRKAESDAIKYDGVAESAVEYISKADMLIVGGTSLAIYPAASFVRYFKGKYLVIINKTVTDYDYKADLVVRDNIGEFFESVIGKLKL